VNRAGLVVLVLLGGSCGGRGTTSNSVAQPAPSRPLAGSAPLQVEAQPLQIDFAAERLGTSLRVDIECVGRGVEEGQAFEAPEHWTIRAHADGAELKRLVNGPVRVARSPVGSAHGTKWDVTVLFSVVFEVTATTREVDVAVTAPDSAPVKRRVTI
jgi:hypothetical protein